jgi:lipopolysaccharide transport system permease protein
LKALLLPIWSYRGFILGSVKREFQSRYRNSILGAAWTVLNPLAMIFVYTIIFAQLMKTRLAGMDSTFAYSIYLCAGVLTWGLFAEIVGRSQTVFLENANLLKKLSFPRVCLPIITVLNAILNFAIIGILFVCFLVLSGNFPGWVFFAVIPVLLIQIMFAIGLGVLLGVLNVFFRDVGQFFGIFLQFWFWFTPVVYPVNVLPDAIGKYLLVWNPMAPIIGAYQAIFVNGQMPYWPTLLIPTFVGFVLCILAMQLFRKRAGEMVDEL